MKPYRKEDQHYYDSYDRLTIKDAKEFQKKEKPDLTEAELNILKSKFIDILRTNYRNRSNLVKEMMLEDERKDLLVSKYKVPFGTECMECGKKLVLVHHLFNTLNESIIFVFDCVNKSHKSRTLVLPNGDIKYVPRPVCKKCGEPITSSSKKRGNNLIITDKCTNCGEKNIETYDMTPDSPIVEEERKIYCLTDYGNTFMEDLKRIEEFMNTVERLMHKIDQKKIYDVDKIEMLTLPKIKERLQVLIQQLGYTDFLMEKPRTDRAIIVKFSIQDPIERSEEESTKLLNKELAKTLIFTNWRLSGTLDYKLGYLEGQLIGYSDNESIMKLAKKLKERDEKT